MCKVQSYVGALTPFGVIVQVEDRLFNGTATVRHSDGSSTTYRLPFLIAHGLQLTGPVYEATQLTPG